MPNQIIASDYLLLQTGLKISGLIDSTGLVRLFTNNVDPGNSTTFAAFTQPIFAGYNPVPMSGKSRGVKQLASGVIQVPFSAVGFSNPSGPSQLINGWFISDFGTTLIAMQRWPAARLLPSGGTLLFAPTIQVRGLNLQCP